MHTSSYVLTLNLTTDLFKINDDDESATILNAFENRLRADLV